MGVTGQAIVAVLTCKLPAQIGSWLLGPHPIGEAFDGSCLAGEGELVLHVSVGDSVPMCTWAARTGLGAIHF